MYLLEDVFKKQEIFHCAKAQKEWLHTIKPKFDLEAHQRALMVVASE